MPAPIKWINMIGANTTDTFKNQSWQNTERTNAFMQNAFGNLARHWSSGHNANTDPTVRAKVARYYELYQYLVGDDNNDGIVDLLDVKQLFRIYMVTVDRNNEEFVNFLFYSGGLIYLKPVGPKPKCY